MILFSSTNSKAGNNDSLFVFCHISTRKLFKKCFLFPCHFCLFWKHGQRNFLDIQSRNHSTILVIMCAERVQKSFRIIRDTGQVYLVFLWIYLLFLPVHITYNINKYKHYWLQWGQWNFMLMFFLDLILLLHMPWEWGRGGRGQEEINLICQFALKQVLYDGIFTKITQMMLTLL